MPDNQTIKGNARRKLLKGIAAGSGAVIAGKNLPDSWSRPVVDAVILPAHAQTSMRSFTSGNDQGSIAPDSQFARALDGLVSEAHAGAQPIEIIEVEQMFSAQTCIQENDDGTVRVDCILSDGYLAFKLNASDVPVGGSAVSMTGDSCPMSIIMKVDPPQTMLDDLGLITDAHAGIEPDRFEVRIDSIEGNARGEYLIGKGGNLEIDLPPGECSPPGCPPPIPNGI